MNDQDKEEFNEWLDEWSNEACSNHSYSKGCGLMTPTEMHIDSLMEKIEKLQAENAKLRECVEFYANFMNYSNLPEYGDGVFRTAVFSDMEEINEFTKFGGKRARRVLKELEEK